MTKTQEVAFRLVRTAMFWCLALSPALAASVNWTIADGTMSDGATFSGTFTYNSDLNSISVFNVSVTAGNLTAFTYDNTLGHTFSDGGTISGYPIIGFSAGTRYFYMAFAPALTNAGGTSAIYLSSGNSAEFATSPSFAARDLTAGTATASSAVPEPSTWALVGIGLLAAALIRTSRRTLATGMPFQHLYRGEVLAPKPCQKTRPEFDLKK